MRISNQRQESAGEKFAQEFVQELINQSNQRPLVQVHNDNKLLGTIYRSILRVILYIWSFISCLSVLRQRDPERFNPALPYR